ncbi:glycosyltransferase family 31 protein [Phlyctema vagabunda]|uniref:Glycosyltransferase family 31 protein n=1 Tax=Phlyctema vagabunda TaxID=108571 RepID=A0ABR4PXJ2_9HELO
MSLLNLKIRPTSRFSNIRFLLVALVLLAIIQVYLSLPVPVKYYWKWTWNLHNISSLDVCSGFSGLENVVITVKTGATEAYEKIPTQLQTSLRCAPHVYVFSDMAQSIGDTKIYDVLEDIPAEITDENPDFDIYRKQKILEDPSKIPSILKDFKNPKNPDEYAAWTLDKYKNVHIVEAAWALKPEMDWYLHIDADTYVLWPSLVAWVEKLDPSNESFFGSLVLLDDKSFAHGGSGILLSGAATRSFAVEHNGTAARWDPKIHENCCGDFVLAEALREYDIEVSDTWPTINGERPDTISFSADNWCEPLVTMHHVSPAQAERIGSFEEARENKTMPVLHSEIFQELVWDTIPDTLMEWDNMSDDKTIKEAKSPEACIEACSINAECLQSLYNGQECKLGTKTFQLGQKYKPGKGETWHSSWNRTRIETWMSGQDPCTKVRFPFEE